MSETETQRTTDGGTPTPRHHLPDEVLLDFADGTVAGPVAILAASHLVLCARCRHEVAGLEALGGTLLDNLAPAPLASDALAAVLGRLDEPPPAAFLPPAGSSAEPALSLESGLPRPLCRLLGQKPLEQLAWKPFLPGLRQIRVKADGGDVARLLAIRPGAAFPRHTHRGQELTLVLRGAYRDECGRFQAGDVAIADPEVRHRPKAEPGEDCVCLLVSEAPVRFTGPIGRWFNPLIPF